MKILIALLMLTTTAVAQIPKTVDWKENGQVIGTATFSGDRIYLRDLKGAHVVTIVVEKDGNTTIYDPSGNVINTTRKP